MIKQYKITVNGKLYDVSVEEVGEILGGVNTLKTVSTFVNSNAAVNNSNNEKQIADKPQNAILIDENAISIKAPMPGTILSFTVSVGDEVSEGQVVAILEAMKMEIPVVAPEAGTIASIDVAVGDSIEAGAVLATLK